MTRTRRYLIVLWTVLLSSLLAAAQTPVANRVKAVIRHLPREAAVVAKYTDNARHSLYYTLHNRLYRFDVLKNTNEDITFADEGYSRILATYLSPDGNFVFIAVDRGSLANFYPDDGQVLWRIDSRTRKPLRIQSGFKVEKQKSCFVVRKAYRCLNPKALPQQQKWTARNHYYDLFGTVLFAKEEYPIKIRTKH